MTAYLEPQFDCIIEINNDVFECKEGETQNGTLKIDNIERQFVVRFYPNNPQTFLSYACLIKSENNALSCNSSQIKITNLGDQTFLIRALPSEVTLSTQTHGDLLFIKTCSALKVLNTRTQTALLETKCKSFEIDKTKNMLTVFKNFSKCYNCGLIEKFALNENKIEIKESFCACKNMPNETNESDIAKLFFEASKAQYFKTARSFLSEELSNKMPNALKDFFAPYGKISKNNFTGKGYILHPENPNDELVFVEFKLNEHSKIDNITEIV